VRGVKVFWDRAGRDSNVGREPRYIYVERDDPQRPYDRLLIDITYYVDEFVESVVLPNLFEYLRRAPPFFVSWLFRGEYFRDENEFFAFNKLARPFAITVKYPYSLIDYTRYWRQITLAKLQGFSGCFFIEAVAPRPAAVEKFYLRGIAELLLPREIYERWLAMKAKLDSLLQQLEPELEEGAAQAPKELHVEFE
jgi:hypothetical protein